MTLAEIFPYLLDGKSIKLSEESLSRAVCVDKNNMWIKDSDENGTIIRTMRLDELEWKLDE